MKSPVRVSVVLPVYKDEATVREVVTRARGMLDCYADEYEIIIVDDASPDGSGKIADQLASEQGNVIRTIHHSENRGYGAALKSGIEAARYEWICTVDGDNEYDVFDLEKMLDLRHYYLLIIAFRYKKLYSAVRIFISFIYNLLLRRMFRTHFRDVSTGIRAFHRSILDDIEIVSDGPFFGAELAIKAMLRGYPVGEIGIQTYPRTFGSGSTTSLRGIMLTISDMIRVRREIFSDNYQLPTHRPRRAPAAARSDAGYGGGFSGSGWLKLALKKTPLLRWRLVAAISAAAAALLIYWFRDRQAFISPQFWAEDGIIFWLGQYVDGWRAIFTPFVGYLHLVPRLTAFVASFFNPGDAPRFYATAAIAFTCWSVATAASAIENPFIGFLFGLAIMLPPNPSGELLGTVTDTQWFLAPTLALIAATDSPAPRLLKFNRALFATIAGLTGPFSIFAAPLAARAFWQRRDWVMALIVVCGTVQAVIALLHPFNLPVQHEFAHNVELEVLRVFASSSINVAAGTFVIAAFLLIAPGRELRTQLLFFGGLILFAAGWKARIDPFGFEELTSLSRYFYAPQVIIIWCAISLILSDKVGAAVGLLWFALSIVNYPTQWFFAAPKPDMHWQEQIRDLGKRDLAIPVSPNPDWTIRIPINQDR